MLSLIFIPLFAQEPELGLPGDNLNLYGVLNIFQNSPTLEEFEKNLNAENSKVNNLDINGNGRTDYIHVVDNMNGSAHAIVLRVDVNETETQDVAVIEVEKDANNQVHVQIVGDEALYGKDYIVEPNQSTPNPGYGRKATENVTYYSPASWAIIDYMFTPRYVMYRSPYHWGYYPHYWHPWSPLSYHSYYGFHRPYYDHFRRSDTYHSPAAHEFYGHHRVSSPIVRERYHSPRIEQPPRNRHEPTRIERLPRNRHEAPRIEQSPRNHSESPHPTNHQPARINQEPRRTNNQPARINQEPRRTNNQPARINQEPRRTNNQPARINQEPRRTNNQPARINQEPRRTNNQPARVNQTPRSTNNQPARVNQAPRSTNNQPARVNQAPRQTNRQPAKVNQTPRPANRQPAKQPVKSNPDKKKVPPKK
jgi:hypothetical protein